MWKVAAISTLLLAVFLGVAYLYPDMDFIISYIKSECCNSTHCSIADNCLSHNAYL